MVGLVNRGIHPYGAGGAGWRRFEMLHRRHDAQRREDRRHSRSQFLVAWLTRCPTFERLSTSTAACALLLWSKWCPQPAFMIRLIGLVKLY